MRSRPHSAAARIAFGLALLLAGAAPAATFQVEAAGDAVDAAPGDGACRTRAGDCTLRAAVMEANALPGFDQVLLATDVRLTLPAREAEESDAAVGDLDVSDHLALVGLRGLGRPARVAVESGHRHLHVLPGAHVMVVSLALEGGDAPSQRSGGAIRVDYGGALFLARSTLRGNRASVGAAIYNTGQLVVEDSLLEENRGGGGEGAALFNAGDLELRRSRIVNRVAADGALANVGTALVEESHFGAGGGAEGCGVRNAAGGSLTWVRSAAGRGPGSIRNWGSLRIVDGAGGGVREPRSDPRSPSASPLAEAELPSWNSTLGS